jgi:hypothetical protein
VPLDNGSTTEQESPMGPTLIDLTHAATIRDERLRVADARRHAETTARLERMGGGVDAHERHRALVRLSLLLSRQRDRAPHRRWA